MICEQCKRDADPPKCWWCGCPVEEIDDYSVLKTAEFAIDGNQNSRLVIKLNPGEHPYTLEIETSPNEFIYRFKKHPVCTGIIDRLRADCAFIHGKFAPVHSVDGWNVEFINGKVLAETFMPGAGPVIRLVWKWLI